MDGERFVRERPCLDEIEGWLLGRTIQKLPLTGDILKPVNDYKARLMAGKEIPAPTKLPRNWVYQRGRKPVFKPKGPLMPAPEPQLKGKAPFRADRNDRKSK